ncbi:MAG: lysophospholipid acyltransferase family protein [Nitrospinae bacterium]|nr:lysophospholipid acyltransferase family protein [Nitrospinota bacterium]
MAQGEIKRLVNATAAPWLAYGLIQAVSRTLDARITGDAAFCQNNRHILAFWHSRIFYMPYYFRREKNLHALVSPSADGDIIAGALRRFGIFTVRGSSFQKGPASLVALAKRVRHGANAAMIADGSRGPARIAQPGSIYLAMLTGAPIVPIAFGAEKKRELGSWDRTLIPLPFSRVNMVFGAPMHVPRKLSEEEIEKNRLELEAAINRVTDMADRFE